MVIAKLGHDRLLQQIPQVEYKIARWANEDAHG